VGPRAGLKAMENRKICFPGRESNSDRLVSRYTDRPLRCSDSCITKGSNCHIERLHIRRLRSCTNMSRYNKII
jgi:hypothetical protein